MNAPLLSEYIHFVQNKPVNKFLMTNNFETIHHLQIDTQVLIIHLDYLISEYIKFVQNRPVNRFLMTIDFATIHHLQIDT